jgi:hypothetical protein
MVEVEPPVRAGPRSQTRRTSIDIIREPIMTRHLQDLAGLATIAGTAGLLLATAAVISAQAPGESREMHRRRALRARGFLWFLGFRRFGVANSLELRTCGTLNLRNQRNP